MKKLRPGGVKSSTQDYTAISLTELGYDHKRSGPLISAPNFSAYCPHMLHVELQHVDPIKGENLLTEDHNGSDGERELVVVWVGGLFRSSELTEFSAHADWILWLTAPCPSKEMDFDLGAWHVVSLSHLALTLRVMNT